jgi:hypothetical protein
VGVVGAGDVPVEITRGVEVLTPEVIERIGRELESKKCGGGADNVPALERAWDMAAEAGCGVVWLHGPQGVLLRQTEGLEQRMERRGGVVVTSLQIGAGANRILERLDGRVVSGRLAGVDAGSLVAAVVPSPWHSSRRELGAGEVVPEGAYRASNHLARLWASEEVARLMGSGKGAGEAAGLAVRYQLVTPVSGAVVLETAEQYAANKLVPAAGESVPTVPEPTSLMLLMGPVAYLLLGRRRRAG